MKRIIATVACLVLALSLVGLVGCASSPTSNPSNPTSATTNSNTRSPLTVSESAYHANKYGSIEYVAIIENPNSEWVADSVQVKVTAKDSKGTILFTNTEYVSYIFANGKKAIQGQASSSGSPATVTFEPVVKTSGWTKESTQAGDTDDLFPITNLNEVTSSYGSVAFTGEITNNLKEDVSALKVYVVLRDGAGKLISGYSTYVKDIPSGGTGAFQVYAYGDVPAHASIEAYADHSY